MSVQEIVSQLQQLGSESYRKVLRNHDVPEPLYGVKIEDLKKIQKQFKHDNQVAKELFDTGIYDAQYLAGLIADGSQMSKKELRDWLKKAKCAAISEYTVPWVAAESKYGRELALEWIDSKNENVATAGWSTYGGLVSTLDDDELDMAELKKLLRRVEQTIHKQPNRVRYVMNGFVIAVGSYVKELTELAIQTAEKIGTVTVDMGDTSCKVPSAVEYITKVQKRGTIGKKRKSVKC